MPTTIQVDDAVIKELRAAVKKKYGRIRGAIGKEVKIMVQNHIKLLKSKDYNPEV